MGDKNTISVTIPVHNRERFLRDCIQSVIDQQFEDMEILIVDDGSTDDTAGVARSLAGPIRYFYQPKAGAAAARNLGVKHARGEYLAFLDSDDLWPPGKLARQLRVLQGPPPFDVVVGHKRFFRSPLDFDAHSIPSLGLPAMLCRKSVWTLLGGLDETLRHGEDLDFFMRVSESRIPIAYETDVAVHCRYHEGNMSHALEERRADMLKLLGKKLARNRQDPNLGPFSAPTGQ